MSIVRPQHAIGGTLAAVGLNNFMQTLQRAENWLQSARNHPHGYVASRKYLEGLRNKRGNASSMPRFGKRPYARRGTKRTRVPRKARKIRSADRTLKRAKKRRNARVLMKIPRPIGGLTARKVVRLVTSDNCFFACVPPSGHTDGGAINATQSTQYQTKTFVLNDLGAPVVPAGGGNAVGSGWRPYRFDTTEGGALTHEVGDGFVPGWDRWTTFYNQAEVVGCKMRIKWLSVDKTAATDSSCYVGYMQTHDRTPNGDAPKPKDALKDLPAERKINMSEDLVRAKMFSLRNLKPEAPGDTATQYCTFNVRSAFPHGATNQYSTTQTINKDINAYPGPVQNKSYVTLICIPTANLGQCHVEARIEMEWTVLYSELKEEQKTTQQIFSSTVYSELK